MKIAESHILTIEITELEARLIRAAIEDGREHIEQMLGRSLTEEEDATRFDIFTELHNAGI